MLCLAAVTLQVVQHGDWGNFGSPLGRSIPCLAQCKGAICFDFMPSFQHAVMVGPQSAACACSYLCHAEPFKGVYNVALTPVLHPFFHNPYGSDSTIACVCL